jgi:hypothetical protein
MGLLNNLDFLSPSNIDPLDGCIPKLLQDARFSENLSTVMTILNSVELTHNSLLITFN